MKFQANLRPMDTFGERFDLVEGGSQESGAPFSKRRAGGYEVFKGSVKVSTFKLVRCGDV